MPYVHKLNEMKDHSKLTSQEISDRSGIPIGTINRILAG